jgi:hypothetical protein
MTQNTNRILDDEGACIDDEGPASPDHKDAPGFCRKTVVRWFVKCKTCDTPLADQDSSFTYDPNHPQWQSLQWKSDIKCPECHHSHEYTSADLEVEGSG